MILFVNTHNDITHYIRNDIVHSVHNDIILNRHFCVSKNFIQLVEFNCDSNFTEPLGSISLQQKNTARVLFCCLVALWGTTRKVNMPLNGMFIAKVGAGSDGSDKTPWGSIPQM